MTKSGRRNKKRQHTHDNEITVVKHLYRRST